MAEPTGGTNIRGIGTIAVPVTDPERALAFYTGTLGLALRRDASFGEGLRWIEVAPAGATTTIALAPPGDVSAGVDTGIRLSTDDPGADHASLRARGVDVDEVMHW